MNREEIMIKKGAAILLFILVTLGFLYGFFSYNRRLNEMLQKEIVQGEVLEPSQGNEEPVIEIPVESPVGGSEEPIEEEVRVSVPDLLGLHRDEAEKLLKELKLVPEVHLEFVDDVDKDLVFYQRPTEDRLVLEGTVVSFSVSQGPYGSAAIRKVKMPALSGKTEAEAKSMLTNLNLFMKVVRSYSETVKTSQIISQSIPKGTEIDEASTVSITVSLGKEQVMVPNVLGLMEGEARNRLESLGLKFSVEKKFSEEPLGTVLSQSLSSGAKVDKSSQILIYVSKGPEIIEKPDPVPPESPTEGEEPGDPVESPEG